MVEKFPPPDSLDQPEISERFNAMAKRSRSGEALNDEELRYAIDLSHELRRRAAPATTAPKGKPQLDVSKIADQF